MLESFEHVCEEVLDELLEELVVDDVQDASDGVETFPTITISRMKIVMPQISHAVVSHGSHAQ